MSSEQARDTDKQEAIFAWRGDRVVLLVERAESSWVVARGWRRGDRLVDIRRWSFSSPQLLAGQVRRLVREATGNHRDADATATALLAWAAEQADATEDSANPREPVSLASPDHLPDGVD